MAPHGIVGISRFFALRLGVSLTAVGGLFVQMLCHVAWQYVYYCLRALPCLCAKIHAHSGKRNASASCEWGSTTSKQRSFCANAVSCRLTICILLPARPSLPLRKDPRPQRQAQHLGVVPSGWRGSMQKRSFCANAVSCRLWVSILLPARPSLPLRKDPRPQRQAQHLGVVLVGECHVKTAVFLCKCRVMPLGKL